MKNQIMNIKNIFCPLLAMAAMTITSCSNNNDDDAAAKVVNQIGTFQVSINVGPAQTRAISVGGNDGHTLYTNWDNGDEVQVVKNGTTTVAGTLTAEGAKKLDVSGHLKAGIPVCPPEGDAGTGMVATNAVKQRTGNVSAGTSSFSMIVLEKPLSKPYEMIDMVTTPDGSLVAMVHCNNCTSDINAWVGLFKEYQQLLGVPVDMNELYGKLFNKALEGDTDCGGLMAYNYVSGEPVTGLADGRPLFVRSANDKFNLANFMRANLYGAIGVLKIGNDILFKEEKIKVDRITGHGGYFKTAGVGQRMLAAALNSPISVMETAGEGGAWGIALLAGYLINKNGKNLADYLEDVVFAGNTGVSIAPTAEDVAGFEKYIENYKKCLPIEQAAVDNK